MIGDGCVIAPRAMLERIVTLATNVRSRQRLDVGGDPQDLKFQGERTRWRSAMAR